MRFSLHPTLEKETILVKRVKELQIWLVNDIRYFWVKIIPETAAVELRKFNDDIAWSLWAMTRHPSGALKKHCNAAKISNAAMCNVLPQLHVHTPARHNNDSAWPQLMWGRGDLHS